MTDVANLPSLDWVSTLPSWVSARLHNKVVVLHTNDRPPAEMLHVSCLLADIERGLPAALGNLRAAAGRGPDL